MGYSEHQKILTILNITSEQFHEWEREAREWVELDKWKKLMENIKFIGLKCQYNPNKT